MPHLVITAVGPDRAGLVDDLTAHLRDANVNIGDSRMARLGGQFALIMEVEGDAAQLDALRANLPGAGERFGLTITLAAQDDTTDDSAESADTTTCRVTVTAKDRPGIVHKVAHTLYSFDANIEDLTTHPLEGEYGATPTFNMSLTVTLPKQTDMNQLRAALNDLANDLGGDVVIDD